MDYLELAVKHVAETKHLLERLIRSSESFDYIQAKKSLELLERKIRDLGHAKARLESLRPTPPQNVCTVDFGLDGPKSAGELPGE